jgi:hypothetical protein
MTEALDHEHTTSPHISGWGGLGGGAPLQVERQGAQPRQERPPAWSAARRD